MGPGLRLVLGPPASGKTTLALEEALGVLGRGGRVWWIGLPHQREYLYALLGRRGAWLGLEFLTFQALYYRVLAEVGALRPLLPGAGRVALVGEALRAEGPLAPGEARLFARAIAELKRFGLGPLALPKEGEAGRLRRVYFRYERLKGRAFDYDDFRHKALKVPLRLHPEPGLVVVDGFREIGPLDRAFLERLARKVPVLLTLERPLPGLVPWRCLEPRPISREVWALENPVQMVRHLLRALKRALAPKDLGGEGLDPSEVLVVAPEGRIPGVLLLGEEYGLPLWDGRQRALGRTEAGMRLLALLNPVPTGSDLLLLGFSALGRAALRRGVVGLEALEKLAREEGLEGEFQAYQALLPPRPPADPLAFAQEALARLGVGDPGPPLELLRHALKVSPEDPWPWWRSFLLEGDGPPLPRLGVAVVPPLLAMGVRARRVYVLDWVQEAYTLGEREDYFFLEEGRAEELVQGQLPKRLRGLEPLFWEEIRTRGEEVVLLYPESEGTPIEKGKRPPPLPPGAPLEAHSPRPLAVPWPRAKGLPRHLEILRLALECPFRAYVENLGPWPREDGSLGWHRLPRDLEALRVHPEVGPWIRAHEETLRSLAFWKPWPLRNGLTLRLDAVRRVEGRVHLYRLLPPGASPRLPELKDRWTELYALGVLLRKGERFTLYAWPWLGRPKPLLDSEDYGAILAKVQGLGPRVEKALGLWQGGTLRPRPGAHCYACPYGDLCRKEEA